MSDWALPENGKPHNTLLEYKYKKGKMGAFYTTIMYVDKRQTAFCP